MELPVYYSDAKGALQTEHLFFEIEEQYKDFLSTVSGDWILAAFLLIAMRNDKNLIIDYPISKPLFNNAEKIMKIFNAWYPKYSVNKVVSPSLAEMCSANGKDMLNAAFFTLGVDSFFTLLSHLEDEKGKGSIDYIIFVRGFDIPLRSCEELYIHTKENIEAISDKLGVKPIFISTNLREIAEKLSCSWDIYHGAALATVSLLLSNKIKKIFIPATSSPNNLVAWGSHFVTDPLWSNGSLEIYHDGFEFPRFEKIQFLCNYSELAGRNLRVCYKNRLMENVPYNCGKCEKCLRTIIPVYLNGKLAEFSCFPNHNLSNLINNLKNLDITKVGLENT